MLLGRAAALLNLAQAHRILHYEPAALVAPGRKALQPGINIGGTGQLLRQDDGVFDGHASAGGQMRSGGMASITDEHHAPAMPGCPQHEREQGAVDDSGLWSER